MPRDTMNHEGPAILGNNPAVLTAIRTALSTAETRDMVLLCGEPGTGKTHFAHAIHAHGPRRDRPLRILDAGRLTPLLRILGEPELAGMYLERVRFLREMAGGTLLVTNIDQLNPRDQGLLLRALDASSDGGPIEFSRDRLDIRLLLAASANVEAEVMAGRLRVDLYLRLCGQRIALPPLSARREDIPLLARHFLAELTGIDRGEITIATTDEAILVAHDWPGNLDELRCVMQTVAQCRQGREIGCVAHPCAVCPLRSISIPTGMGLREARRQVLAAFERAFIYQHWADNGWDVPDTAAAIGMSPEWLDRRIRRHALRPPPQTPPVSPHYEG